MEEFGYVEGLDAVTNVFVIVELAEFGSVHTILDPCVLHDLDLARPLLSLLRKSVRQVLMQCDLALRSIGNHWSDELL